jgi:Xaa-Pro dipeptidase
MTQNRLSNLIVAMKSAALDALVLNPGPSLSYLTGLSFHLMERPTVLLVSVSGQVALVLPKLEAAKLGQSKIAVQPIQYGDNPAEWGDAFRQASQMLELDGKKIGVEPIRLRFLELEYLRQAAPRADFVSAAGPLESLRLCKDTDEVARMRQAVKIAQDGLEAILPMIKAGVTEKEIASELTIQMLRFGGDAEAPFSPIVSSGPNSANPHATPSERKLAPGDLLVIDWGTAYQGYVADLTRTFGIEQVEPEFRKIAEVVAQANAAGRAVAAPGLRAGAVDAAAREVIKTAGYGPYFTHRVGHGIGLEGHEPPYMFGENPLVLAEGMAFTIEPGIYLPGRGGVRIEDNVIVTSTGVEVLSSLPRELRILL